MQLRSFQELFVYTGKGNVQKGTVQCNVIETKICFHAVNGVIRIKIEHVFGMITSY